MVALRYYVVPRLIARIAKEVLSPENILELIADGPSVNVLLLETCLSVAGVATSLGGVAASVRALVL